MTGNPGDHNPSFSTDLYVLKYRKPVPIESVVKWGIWFEKHKRTVRRTFIGSNMISTVFLGIDHSFSDKGKPLLFETMVFPSEDIQFRCSTWREALYQHWETVRSVKAKQKWK